MDTSVTEFLSGCRFGQTEVGSYVVSVICPMIDINDANFRDHVHSKDEVDFTRKVTEKVITSIQKIKDRIDNGQYNLAKTSIEDEMSVNFYEALNGMQTEDEGTTLEFIPKWSPSLPALNEIPKSITVSRHYYQSIHATISDIRGAAKKKKKIIGLIRKLEAQPDLKERKAGKVTVKYVDSDGKAKTTFALLDKTDYDRAVEAHLNGWYVELFGEMTEGKRSEMKWESFVVL